MTNNFGTQFPTPIEIGHGVKLAATQKSFMQGSAVETNNDLDLMIQGEGFFQVQMANGEVAYTRDGSFKMDAQGNIVTAEGYYVMPEVTIPPEAQRVVVRENGDVLATINGATESELVGQIRTVKFANNAGLESIGNNLYKETEASGQPVEGIPAFEGYGSIMRGMLETSNVKLVEEMVGLITSQRAYEINAKAITTSDEMLGLANDLKR
jgi:flagellar basal-body rod protein FlgG